MPQINRPTKQGGATTYGGKVSAGYTTILASEMDADLDTIYSAWNAGVDSSNIQPGSITGDKLAPGAVGSRELADSGVQTVDLAAGAVTTPKLADGAVTNPKLTVGCVTATNLAADSVGSQQIINGSVTSAELAVASVTAPAMATNSVGTEQLIDNAVTAPKLAVGAVTAPAMATDSVGTQQIIDGSVTRTELAPGALPGANVTVSITAFSTSTQGQWLTVATLPALTTRGANAVFLITNHGLSGVASTAPGLVTIRWTRNGAHLCNTGYATNGAGAFPVPSLPFLDIVSAAGTYTYALQVMLGSGMANVSFSAGGLTGCALSAIELG